MSENNEAKKNKGLSIAGLVLSIIALCTSFLPLINNLSFAIAIMAIIFAIISLIQKSKKGMIIATIIISIIACALVLKSQSDLGKSFNDLSENISSSWNEAFADKTEENLANKADVVLGEFKLEEDDYGYPESELPVTVTNKTSEKKSISIQIESVTTDGTRIDTDTIYASDLGAGQTQNFKAFSYIPKEKVEEYKNATFKIVTVDVY